MRTFKDEYEKLQLIAELKGQLIDIFEDFLDEKGIIIENPERYEDENLDPEETANIFGSDYDEIGNKIERTLTNWGVFDKELSIDTPAGELISYIGNDHDNLQAGIYFRPKDIDGKMDIALAEIQGEDLRENTGIGEEDIVLYTWEDPFSEDYTRKTILKREEIEESFNTEE